MICVSVTLDEGGCLKGLRASGHSFLHGKAFSPVCAAVSALLGTAAGLFEAESSLKAQVSLPAEGEMELSIGEVPAALRQRCRGVTDFLVYGLTRIAAQEPDDLDLEIL